MKNKIKEDKWSPDTIIGRFEPEGWKASDSTEFKARICVKTVYNYIDKNIFRGVTNKDLWVKKNAKSEITTRFAK